MRAANNAGPGRYVGERAILVRELAGRLELGEEEVRDFFHRHDKEISARLLEATVDIVEELGLREGLIPLKEPLEIEPLELEQLEL